ncbi:MAG: ATP phosphoribosyltransferase regulatory subunit, partial [Clostridia bacterium]|nr:ATP phosphoribosyltransferase regulatory subunit [Clostridia bacterium]
TRTVFEFVSTDIGAQGTVCGGGRYNHLVEEVGGKPTPAVGFGLGLERLLLVLENTGKLNAPKECTDLYIAPIGNEAQSFARSLAMKLRAQGISVETDIMDRGVKAQMKYADRSGSRFVLVIGDDEINGGTVRVKNMASGSEQECSLDEVATLIRNG